MQDYPSSRKEAKLQGIQFYHGKVCPNNHGTLRYTKSGGCPLCLRKHMQDNRQKYNERNAKYRESNRDHYNLLQREWRYNNKDKVAKFHRNHFEKNVSQYNSWAKLGALKKRNRVPSWSQIEEIHQFYVNCPEGYQVDHIIPLNGKLVCGLHVIENLQYLTPSENMKKGNKYVVE